MNRRDYITTVASITAAAGLAGCGETSSDDGDDYEGGNGGGNDAGGGATATDGGGEPTATATEEAPAAVLLDHEMVEEEGDYPDEEWDDTVYVQGTVKNQSDGNLRYVQVDVRAFNDDGQQMDTYSDITRDLKAGTEWPFKVEMFDQKPGDVADYEIALDWQA